MAHICRLVLVQEGKGCIVDLVNKQVLDASTHPGVRMSDAEIAAALQPHIAEFLKRAKCDSESPT
jgi:hypothetical protein